MKIDAAIPIIIQHEPDIQAIYLFGSFGTKDERSDSDLDLGLLLPPGRTESLSQSSLVAVLAELFEREVDLINLRRVDTVFQKEIVMADQRLYCPNQAIADEFEMRVLSDYQKLNEERHEIIAEGLEEGRFVA